MEITNCNHLIDYFNRALTEEEMNEFEAHLNQCQECREELKELTEITGELPFLSEPIHPPSGMKKRILDNIFEEQRSEDGQQSQQPRTQVIQKKSWWTPLIAAALFISLVGNGYALMKINEEKAKSTNLASAVNTVKLQPNENFSGSGKASIFTYENELNVVVQTEQLKGIEGDQVYQVWLIKDGKPIPAGSFVPNTQGDGGTYYQIKLDDQRKWDTIAITLEPQPGNQLPKGEIVLSSKL